MINVERPVLPQPMYVYLCIIVPLCAVLASVDYMGKYEWYLMYALIGAIMVATCRTSKWL